MNDPKAGEIYERDGLQREVTSVDPSGMNILWRRPGKQKETLCWISTWRVWVSKAVLKSEETQ